MEADQEQELNDKTLSKLMWIPMEYRPIIFNPDIRILLQLWLVLIKAHADLMDYRPMVKVHTVEWLTLELLITSISIKELTLVLDSLSNS